MLSVLRRKAAASPGVGLLAWRGQYCWLSPLLTVCRFTFPSNTLSGCLEATRPHLQWRNRAGLSPDFPVMPIAGTQGRRCLYHSVVLTRKRAPSLVIGSSLHYFRIDFSHALERDRDLAARHFRRAGHNRFQYDPRMPQISRSATVIALLVAAPGLGSGVSAAQPRRDDGVGVVVYDDVDFQGPALTLRNDAPDLREFRLNDRISSLQIVPGETWEVCESINFSGRCAVLTGSGRDLRVGGWNDLISSMRPARGCRDRDDRR